MPKRKRGKRGPSERLETQLKFFVDKSLYPTRAAALRAVSEAREAFLADGSGVDGVRVVARWRNPDNRNVIHANWKTSEDPGQSIEGAHQTLKSALRAGGGGEPRFVDSAQLPPPSRHLVKSQAMRRYHAAVRMIHAQYLGKSYAWARKRYRRLKK